MKISKTIPIPFWDKVVNFRKINAYGLRDKNNTYLTVDNYNQQILSNSPIAPIYIGFAGILIIFGALFQFKRNV